MKDGSIRCVVDFCSKIAGADTGFRKGGVRVTVRPKKKDSCVQVSEVKKIRVGRSKNIFILDFFFITNVQRL